MNYKIKEISKIVNGATPSTTNPLFWNGTIDWITPKDLTNLNTRLIYAGHAKITQLGYNSCSTKIIPSGTILLSSRAPVGYLAIAGKEMCTNQGFKSIICDEKTVNNYYLYYWFLTKTDYLQSISSGSTFKELSKDTLENIEISLPNMDTQQHIVNTIGSIDDLIENKQQILTKLNNISTLIYKLYKCNNFDSSIKLGECCIIKTGKLNADQSDDNGKYLFFTCGKEDLYINNYAFDCKAIIISGNGEISVKYYEGKFNAYQRTYVLEPKKYFYLFLKECELSINDLKMNSQGSVIKFITKGMLEKINIQINSNSDTINKTIHTIYNNISNINKEIEKLRIIKEILLKKYFS